MLSCAFYPQPSGRNQLEDFALMLAQGTPELMAWMWCDGSVPMGNEEPMREFAAFYRSLPMGRYETTSQADGVFVRRLKGKRQGATVFYVVNTNRKPATAQVRLPGAKATDLVSGQTIAVQGGRFTIPLKQAEMRAFRAD